MIPRVLTPALAVLSISCVALAEPSPLLIEGALTPELTVLDAEGQQRFGHDRITHITFHHEGFAGTDAALFRRASAARERQGIARRVRNIDRYHATQAGLGMFAYHYAVDRHGQIAKGRPVRFKPATRSTRKGLATRADFAGHFAVVALGDFNHERLTDAGRRAYVRVMSEAQRAYRVPTGNIRPHLDHADTACPGAHIAQEAENLRRMVLFYGLQDELSRRGCGALSPDGLWGPRSAEAFAAFLRNHDGRFRETAAGEAALFEMIAAPDLRCR